MKIFLHIGLPYCGLERIQDTLADKRDQLIGKGVLYPKAAGRKNHTRLYMAVSDPDHVDQLRAARGFAAAKDQAELREMLAHNLASEVARHEPKTLILSALQLAGSLHRGTELQRLRDLLAPLSEDIQIIAHVDEQARVLIRHYAAQLISGRTASLGRELELVQSKQGWRAACMDMWGDSDPARHRYPEIDAPPFWLDYAGLVSSWEQVFGAGTVRLRPFDAALFQSRDLTGEICEAFDLPRSIGKADKAKGPPSLSAESLARGRQMNLLFDKAVGTGRVVPGPLRRRMLNEVAVDGVPVDPGSLSALSRVFAKANAALLKSQPQLTKDCLRPDAEQPDWTEAGLSRGFRASQYFAAFLPLIEQATKKNLGQQQGATPRPAGADAPAPSHELPPAPDHLPPLAQLNYAKLRGGRFAPHNNLGRVNEAELAAPFTEQPMRELPQGSSGNVIVGCMKNEAPYIVEWIAYHRAIGVDNFIIYTNGCEDGTAELLDRLQELGVLQHRNNDNWKGNSPQQYALNQSLKEPLIKNADWIIHIDVDEFINVRTGNGTLQDFLDCVPEATNVAMTWRMFGHNNVTKFSDRPVIEQFDTCAPKYCPKPHTVWGFKTMFKNIGAYEKISCHRPNKLDEGFREQVKWVNGSGKPMNDAVKEKGWRSEVKSVGYDLIQLNHYALRSAESFLIKRQRGRALHVDRSIGINYWVRMDWSDHKDITVQRNVVRLRAEMDRLFQDKKLKKIHDAGVKWHRAKAKELHGMPEFQDLYTQALDTNLNELERVAYALALDTES